jgi:MSHA biogenesis protein MshN
MLAERPEESVAQPLAEQPNASTEDAVVEQAEVARQPQAELPAEDLAKVAEAVEEPVVQTVQARSQPVPVELNQAAPAEPVKAATVRSTQPATTQNQVSVVRSPEWRDRHAAEQAQQLLNEGREHAAREHLLALIADHPAPVASATLLASLYLQSGEAGIAEAFIREATYLPVPVRVRLSAQALMIRGDHAAALELLEENLPQGTRDEDYRALLAALQHKQGAYESSANQYRRLLADFGERPVYWLGLALALDAQREHGSAIEAYRRARVGQQPAVLNYIDQRIAALAR